MDQMLPDPSIEDGVIQGNLAHELILLIDHFQDRQCSILFLFGCLGFFGSPGGNSLRRARGETDLQDPFSRARHRAFQQNEVLIRQHANYMEVSHRDPLIPHMTR